MKRLLFVPVVIVLAWGLTAAAKQEDQITLCHATGNGGYVVITVDSEGNLNGHANHEDDIIPAPESGCPSGETGPVGSTTSTLPTSTTSSTLPTTTSSPATSTSAAVTTTKVISTTSTSTLLSPSTTSAPVVTSPAVASQSVTRASDPAPATPVVARPGFTG